MRSESIPQFAIVKSDSASAFEDALNARMRELARKHPVATFIESDPYFARISYTETAHVPETIADEYELAGYTFTCADCPAFEPILKADGTVDTRMKYGECQFAEKGRTYKDSKCCEYLFRMIQNGRVGLCFTK